VKAAKPKVLWQLSIAVSGEAEEAVEALLQSCYGPAVSYTDVETGTTTLSVYFGSRPDWTTPVRMRLRSGLQRIRRCGLNIGPARISVRKLHPENWAESWKRHFKPLVIGRRLLIRPSWDRRKARRGQQTIVLDPGLSFGTGQHPTTRFCLEQLVSRRKPLQTQSLLDLGTGSGILAIAGVRMGYAPVLGLDFDRIAVQIARVNAASNDVADQLRFRQQDIRRLPLKAPAKYSMICANLASNLLISEALKIVAWLSTGGVLVVAGVLRTEFRAVQTVYERLGLRLDASGSDREWCSGSFVRDLRRCRPK